MSDKSFGDHTNRSIVKNPLLSSAVTGLSLEDLTHKAVLLPAAPSLGQITRSDQQQESQVPTLAYPKHETSIFPSGDAFANIPISNAPQTANQNILDSKKIVNLQETRNTLSLTESKASAKSEDDFDVNEYIARLQGTRYVSAPLHSHIKDDQNTNLEATEENLEEINLNETIPVETQQSITADIAQNFSQLPTVLPHVASAVFSSFSNMLSYKTRDQAPDQPKVDQGNRGYDDGQFQRADMVPMGLEEYKAPKEVAPPPKELPIGGTSNFRITSKKKYAQIPGLSSGDTAQSMTFPPLQNMPPIGQNMPPIGHNMPPIGQNMPPIGQNMPPLRHNIPPIGQNMPPIGQSMPPVAQNISPFGQNIPTGTQNVASHGQNVTNVGQNTPYYQPSFTQSQSHGLDMPPFAQTPSSMPENVPLVSQTKPNIGHDLPPGQIGPDEVQNVPPVQNIPFSEPKLNKKSKTTADDTKLQENIAAQQSQYNLFNPATANVDESKPVHFAGEIQPNPPANSQNFFTPVQQQNIPPNFGNTAVIPPPPMFSNLPRRDSQSSVEKSVLPPSVARRISANQPIMKPAVSAPSFTENIFVPTPLQDVIESGQSDLSSGISSAFVPATISPPKPEFVPPSNLPPSQSVPSSIPTPIEAVTPASYFIPSSEAKPPSSIEPPTCFIPKETESSSYSQSSEPTVPAVVTPNLPPTISSSPSPHFSSFGFADKSIPASSALFSNMPPTLSIFTPSNVEMPQNAPPMFQPPPQSVPTFFNPSQGETSSINAPHPITQMPPNVAQEPPKPVAEPPKASINVNFRMTKKRPQYYAGPIEGVGAISNNVKPVIAPVMPSTTPVEASNFQGALFTPEQPIQPAAEQYTAPNIEQASVPFDISKPVEQVASVSAFDINKPQDHVYGTSFNINQPQTQSYVSDYTPFDMSRDNLDAYNQPQQESKGFGIIGSLKSKLSSIDINKIQSTVTTFFDPAYNDTKVAEPSGQDNVHYQQQQQYGQMPQGQSSFDIFVPNVEHNQSSQFTQNYDYGYNSNYQQMQDPYLQNQGLSQNASSYFADPNYSREQAYSNTSFYDNTQSSHLAAPGYNPQENIPEKVEGLSVETSKTEDQKVFTQGNMTETQTQNPTYDITYQNQSSIPITTETSEQNVNYFDISEDTTQIWAPQQSHDNYPSLCQPHEQHQKEKASPPSTSEKEEPVFYNPNAFSAENQLTSQSQSPLFESNVVKIIDNQSNVTPNIEKTDNFPIEPQPKCDSVLNTSKYNFASLQSLSMQQYPPNAPILSAASFFDNPITTNVSADLTMTKDNQPSDLPNYFDINKSVTDMPTPIGTMSQGDLVKCSDDKDKKFEKEQQVKERNLFESISNDDIHVLGVSTVPLFGLSAIIADKTKETESETSLFDTTQSKNIFENIPATSLFENKEPENKIISEDQVKNIDITGLSINDVKNVLLIEPPQENIGALLKRNASSNKLENLPEKPHSYFNQQCDDMTSVSFHEKPRASVDDNATEIFFKHLDDKQEDETTDSQIVADIDEEHSELNICETCREVSTPEHELKHKEEDFTSHLIENITSRLQLSHPLTASFEENKAPIESTRYDKQLDEIIHVAEETFETLQVQSATELLDDPTNEIRDDGWTIDNNPNAPVIDHNYATNIDSDPITLTHDYSHNVAAVAAQTLGQNYEFKLDPNAVGFFSNNSLFFDNVPVPTNASDEIKAEIKNSHEDIVLPRQMSIPTAPPEEEDLKIDQPGIIDVHSIEQDAKKDFPLEEEFIIEPSTDDFLSTDDDKIELRERKKSSEDSTSIDTFTNRVERFKKKIDNPIDDVSQQTSFGSPPISMASYFDTGNYAVESHYRNSIGSLRIPPGFEEEFARKMSGISLESTDNIPEPYIPDTSTQTRPINTPTYSSPSHVKENIQQISSEFLSNENTEALAQAFIESKIESPIIQAIEQPAVIPEAQVTSIFADTPTVSEVFTQNVQPVTDPMNFFSANVEEPKNEPSAPESFSRLASYFSMPPAQPDHSKSFFELSQSQNHYRHEPKPKQNPKSFFELSQSQNHYIDDDAKNNIKELMKDLTSPRNLQDKTDKTMHYFTIELDNDIKRNTNVAPINIKLDEVNLLKSNIIDNVTKLMENYSQHDDSKPTYTDNNETKLANDSIHKDSKENKPQLTENDPKHDLKSNHTENYEPKLLEPENYKSKLLENDSKAADSDDITKCKYCSRYIPEVNTKVFVVKKAVNEPADPVPETEMQTQKEKKSDKIGNTVNFVDYDVEKQAEDKVTVINEHRNVSDYSPVKHHWFYRVDVEEKSVWRGFSNTDSNALEEAYHSPDLNENTLVATDGGRYDVNIVGRLRIAVYWKQKPTNVRRCSWFYKGTTDARYVPYTEPVAEKLEEEYRHGITTGEWHRRMILPNSEMVIMHGPTVMVHFLHSGATDAFTTPPNLLGKRVYRNPPKLRVARDQTTRIDHLILLVHGAGEYKKMMHLDQAASRPRVVRRSHEESEIEECEPSRIDHLLLLCHGVGSACDMRFRSVEEVVEDFRATSLQLLQSHYRNSYDNGLVSRVEVLPISWHEQLHSGEGGVDRRLARVTLDSIPRLRAFTNHTVLDVLFYTSPVFHQTIIDTVCFELNRVYSMFRERNPHFTGEVSLGGHSLGSVILYDLLCHQAPESPLQVPTSPNKKHYVAMSNGKPASPPQPLPNYPQLVFPPSALYALGSPIAIFECIRGVESLGMDFALPTCKNFFNIFHPYDPIAYRIEPLINPVLQQVKPSQIPHHKGRKRMHLELKDTMVRVGSDLKQKLIESLRTTWNKWKSTPPPDGQLEKVVEEEMEKEQLAASEEETASELQATTDMLGRLNAGRRVDYVLQEAPLEMINEYLFAMSSHVGYWESEDTMLLMLREIYDSLGVQPDSTVPQQSMTVQRTKTVSQDDSGKVLNETDSPSTSRGST